MISQEIKIGISDYKVSQSPNKLITLGLGSCVGIAIYDKREKIGGLSHIMLPDSSFFKRNIKPEKFADLAIPKMIDEITNGGNHRNLVSKIAGGASMFNFPNGNSNSIGERNTMAVENILNKLNIPIIGKDIGGKIGRTMIVDLDQFNVSIRNGNKEIAAI